MAKPITIIPKKQIAMLPISLRSRGSLISPISNCLFFLFGFFVLSGCVPVTDDDFNPSDPFAGAEENLGDWRWIPIDGMRCRDGSETGIGLRLQANATGLLIYLEGGGACFNDASCDGNPKKATASQFSIWVTAIGQKGIFSTDKDANPVRTWHAVYVPYCTGDLHGGNAPDNPVGSTEKNFVGHANMSKVLDLIAPYFSDMDQVLLCGSSAGGVGATLNFAQTVAAFGSTPVALINDSGPFVEMDEVLAPCLQQVFRDELNLAASLPPNCVGCFEPNGDGLAQIYTHYGLTYSGADANMGLISYQQDNVIRKFYSFGADNCAGMNGPFGDLDGDLFYDGLVDLRDEVLAPAGFATFFPTGTTHTLLSGDRFYNETIQDMSVADWVASVLSGAELQLDE